VNCWLATSYSEVTVNVQTAVPLLGHTPGDVFSICRLPHRQRSAAGQTMTSDQALLQLIHIFHWLLIYMMPYTAPNAASRQGWGRGCWLASGQAGWTLVSRSRRRNSTVARARRMEKTLLALCPSKGTAVWTFVVTSEYDVANQPFRILLTL